MYLVEFAVSSFLIAFCSSMWKLEEGFQALNFPVPECSLLSIQWPAYVDKKEGNVKWRQKVKVEICRDGLNKFQNLIRIGLNRLPDSEIRFLNPVPEIQSPKSGPRNPVPEIRSPKSSPRTGFWSPALVTPRPTKDFKRRWLSHRVVKGNDLARSTCT